MGKNFLIDTNVVIDFSHGIFFRLLTRNIADFRNIENNPHEIEM